MFRTRWPAPCWLQQSGKEVEKCLYNKVICKRRSVTLVVMQLYGSYRSFAESPGQVVACSTHVEVDVYSVWKILPAKEFGISEQIRNRAWSRELFQKAIRLCLIKFIHGSSKVIDKSRIYNEAEKHGPFGTHRTFQGSTNVRDGWKTRLGKKEIADTLAKSRANSIFHFY